MNAAKVAEDFANDYGVHRAMINALTLHEEARRSGTSEKWDEVIEISEVGQ